MKQFSTVEDYLELIAGYRDVVSGLRKPSVYFFSPIISLARYDTSVLDSMSQATIDSKALTQRQGELAIKIVVKYKKQLAQKLIDVAPIEDNPKFRVTPRTMDYRKSLTLVDDFIVAKFPYDTKLIESIRGYKKDCMGSCEFDMERKIWKFGLTESNLNWVHTIAEGNGFEIDDEIKQLIAKLADAELTPYKIELTCTDNKLHITNCPSSMQEYIEEKLGGFGIDNLERLVDASGELGFTVAEDLSEALTTQYGKLFTKVATVREAKISASSANEKFKDVIDYAIRAKRLPIVIYEPDHSNKLLTLLTNCYPDVDVQVISNNNVHKHDIVDSIQFVHTSRTLRTLEYIPMLISTAGMVHGSDKQIMFQRAGKVIYFTHEVYRGQNNPTSNIEKID